MKKRIKKFACLGLAIVTCFSLAACGQTEEEKAMNEIAQHVNEEAAADGVDLEAVMEQEYAEFQANQEAAAEQQATADEISAEYDSQIQAAQDTFMTSTDPSEIRTAGETYLALAQERHAKMLAIGAYDSYVDLPVGAIDLKVNHYEKQAEFSSYGYVAGYVSTDGTAGTAVYYNTEDILHGYYTEFAVMRADGSILTCNLSDFITEDSSIEKAGRVCIECQYATPDSIIFAGLSPDYMTTYFYVFNYSGDAVELVGKYDSEEWSAEYEQYESAMLTRMDVSENTDDGMQGMFDGFLRSYGAFTTISD